MINLKIKCYQYSYRQLFQMGNKGTHEQSILTRNWIRIAPSFLRNTLTNELIQEHQIRFDTHDQQSDFVMHLNKRMANHHPHVVKVIYFKIQNENCHCSLNGKRYSLLLYTEYQGPSLATQILSNTVQHTSTCNCLNIITVLEHLQNTYGSFEIYEQLMFMNLRPDMYPGEKTFKLWINSKVEHCKRERLCSEQEMCVSAIKMLKILADHGQCRVMQNHHLSELLGINTFFKLKQELLKLHNKRKKINSFNVQNSRIYRQNSIIGELGQQNKRAVTAKINSMPQKMEMALMPIFPNTSRLVERPLKGESFKSVCKDIVNDIRVGTNHRTLYRKNQNISTTPYSASKINFSFSKNNPKSQRDIYALSTTTEIGPIVRSNVNQKISQPPPIFIGSPRIGNNNQKIKQPFKQFKDIYPVTIRNEKKDGQIKKIVSTPIELHLSGGSIKTVHSSPFYSENEYIMNQISKDIDIAVNQIRQSMGTSKNDASPQNTPQKQGQLVQANEIQKLSDRHGQKIIQTEDISKKEVKNPSLTNSGKKYQKYSQALKEYEQKIKSKNSNKQQRRDKKPIKIDKKINKLVVPDANQSQFKETHSIYNQSIEDTDERQRRRTPSKFRKSSKSKTEEHQDVKDKESESIQNQEEQKMRKASEEKQNRKKEKERQQQKDDVQRIAKQQEQKQEMQRDLQKQKRLIQNEMEGLLRHNNIEYRNIREKVKQKKQTFAQLKAEASKILQDLF